MRLYAYCLSDEMSAPVIEGARGVGGVEPRVMEFGNIRAVVSDVEEETVSVTRENVFAHERVIREVLRQVTPLPFRFGTVVNVERLESYIDSHREELLDGLERVRGAVEMSVKIIWNPEDIRREAVGHEGAGKTAHSEGKGGTGAAYLAAKRREILGDELLKERAERVAAWLRERVEDYVSESNVSLHATEALMLRAAYLVRRERLTDYRERVMSFKSERPELRFLTSGPWPPYSFSNIRA